MEMTDLTAWVEQRVAELHFDPFTLLGCPRRNTWTHGWRSDAGAALLDQVARRERVEWLGRPVGIFMTAVGPTLFLWRGGPWRDWWVREAELLAGMVGSVSNIRATRVCVLHEVDGRTHVRYVETPTERVQTLYADEMTRYTADPDAPPRLHRDKQQAKQLCWRCPVRKRCEALDLESGDTKDWLR